MFGIINPVFLGIAAFGAAVPIVIHLLLRNKMVEVDFAAMRFLLESKNPVIKWLRLKQLLILLLRILIAAILAFAFARPFLTSLSNIPVWNDNESEVAILFDHSASMAAGTNYKVALEKVQELFSQVEGKTSVTFYLAAGKQSRVIAEREAFSEGLEARILAQLEQPSNYQSNLREGLRYIDEVLKGSPHLKRDIYIISDFQKSVWPQNGGELKLESRAAINVLPVAQKAWSNIAIVDGQAPVDRDGKWLCTVTDFGGTTKDARVHLYINGTKVETKEVAFNQHRTRIVRFDKKAVKDMQADGYFAVEASGDVFAADNRFYFSMTNKNIAKILLVNGENESGASNELYFLLRSLNVTDSKFHAAAADAIQADKIKPSAFDAVVLANVKGLNREPMKALESYVQNGGGLIIAPGDKIDPALFNQLFDELSPAKLEKKARAQIERTSGDILLISNVEHPIMYPFSDPANGDFTAARFYQHWQLTPGAGAEVLARFDKGDPAILVSEKGLGKVVLLSFPLDSEWSDFPVKTTYLPLIHNIMNFVRPRENNMQSSSIGEPFYMGDQFSADRAVSVLKPDKQRTNMQNSDLIFADTHLLGIYSLRQDEMQKTIAVNLPTAESETSLFSEKSFLANIDKSDGRVSIDGTKKAISLPELEAEARQQFWRILLLLVLLAIAIESLLANRTPR